MAVIYIKKTYSRREFGLGIERNTTPPPGGVGGTKNEAPAGCLILKTNVSRKRRPLLRSICASWQFPADCKLNSNSRPGGVLEAEKNPEAAVLVLRCLSCVQERREMGQTALETALKELERILLLLIFFLRSDHL